MDWINQHSFLLTAAAALLVLAGLLLHDGARPADLVALGALALGFALAFLWLRPSPADTAEGVAARLADGTPTLLEFQSLY